MSDEAAAALSDVTPPSEPEDASQDSGESGTQPDAALASGSLGGAAGAVDE